MIIMLRIIVVCLVVTLTACAPAGGPDVVPLEGDTSSAYDTGSAPTVPADEAERRTVLFLGTSLTAGYGLGEHVAWPAVLQQKIDSAGLPYRVTNAGISGETSAGGLRRIDWSLQQPVDVLVVELGANDGLRGLPVDAMRENIAEILRRARARYPDIAIVVVGMEAPPNLGASYTTSFRQVYSDLARDFDAALVPFLLDGVAAQAALNIEDGIHPNEEGHRVIARTVWPVMERTLRERATRPPAG
jgi:acyl-CoA thioesterase I